MKTVSITWLRFLLILLPTIFLVSNKTVANSLPAHAVFNTNLQKHQSAQHTTIKVQYLPEAGCDLFSDELWSDPTKEANDQEENDFPDKSFLSDVFPAASQHKPVYLTTMCSRSVLASSIPLYILFHSLIIPTDI